MQIRSSINTIIIKITPSRRKCASFLSLEIRYGKVDGEAMRDVITLCGMNAKLLNGVKDYLSWKC